MTILEEYLKDLAPLVNSDCGSYNTNGVTHMAELMKALYESIGFTCELIDLGPTVGKGMLARNKPEAGYYDIMFNGHLDTVFLDGTASERPLKVVGNKAYGPGCADCKAGVLSSFYALKYARKEDLDRLSICVCYNPDEEIGSKASSSWLCEHGKLAKAVLIFEAARSEGQLVRSRKGVCTYRVTFNGVASHAGNNPEAGRNANIAACRFALAAYDLADSKKGTTVNPGVFKGGSAPNVIAEKAVVDFDLRFWKDEDFEDFDKKFRKLLEETFVDGVTQQVEVLNHSHAMPHSKSTEALVQKINEAARLEGFEASWIDVGGGSDGNHIAKMGVPVVDGCGPAGGGFHCDKEFLRLDTVEERIRMVSRLLSLI